MPCYSAGSLGRGWGCHFTLYTQCFAHGSCIVNTCTKEAVEHGRWSEAKTKVNAMVQLIMQNCFKVTSWNSGDVPGGLGGDKHMRAGRGHLLQCFQCHAEKCVHTLVSFLSRTITWCILYFKKIYLSQSIVFFILGNILDPDICFQPSLPISCTLFQPLRLLQVSIWSHL